MTTQQRREQILQEMNSITPHGAWQLCAQSPAGVSAPFHKLQNWHQGKNQTRYVPAEEVPALQEALAGHQRFQGLAEEFVDLTVRATRQEGEANRKKTPGTPSRTLPGNRTFLKLFEQRLHQAQAVSTEWIEATLRAALLEDGGDCWKGLLTRCPCRRCNSTGQRCHRDRGCEVLSTLARLPFLATTTIRPGRRVVSRSTAPGSYWQLHSRGGADAARTAAQLPYLESSHQLQELAGLKVDPHRSNDWFNSSGPDTGAFAALAGNRQPQSRATVIRQCGWNRRAYGARRTGGARGTRPRWESQNTRGRTSGDLHPDHH